MEWQYHLDGINRIKESVGTDPLRGPFFKGFSGSAPVVMEAFLLDCALDEVETEKAKFKVTSITPFFQAELKPQPAVK